MLERHKRKARERIAAGKFDAGLLSATKWVALAPCAESLYALAQCQVQTRKFHDARETLERLTSLDYEHINARVMLALACYQLREFADARDLVDSVTAADNRLNQFSLHTLADLCMKFKLYPRARDYGERLVRLEPDNPGYWLPLANNYHYCHQQAEAERACHKALALNPDDYGACYALSQYRRASEARNELALFHAVYERTSHNPRARFYLATALGKEYEDLGNFSEAFRWIDIAMSTRRSQLQDHSVEQERQLLQQVESAFAAMDRPRDSGFATSQPVFIVGMPRSGTTLLEQILGVSGDVQLAGELDDFDIALWKQLELGESGQAPGAALLERAGQIDFVALGADYLRSAASRVERVRYFIDKKPQNFINVGFIALALPQARIICLQRNAMDTCFANFKQAYGGNSYLYSYRQEEVARYFIAYRHLMNFWKAQLPGRVLEVKYEDLVAQPEASARRVYEHLDLPWNPECLAFYRNPKVSGSASSEQVRRPIYASSVDHWRYFESQLAPMRQVLGDRLIANE